MASYLVHPHLLVPSLINSSTVERMVFLQLTLNHVMLLHRALQCLRVALLHDRVLCYILKDSLSSVPSVSSLMLFSVLPCSLYWTYSCLPITHHHHHHHHHHFFIPPTPCWCSELVLSTSSLRASFPNLSCNQPPSNALLEQWAGLLSFYFCFAFICGILW